MVPDRKSITDYLTITSGVLGRLLISLLYFLIIANALPVGEFGIFAAAAAIGLILSRLLAFGFISPVYRIATVKPRLLGAYLAGLALLTILSLPAIGAVAGAVFTLFFSGKTTWLIFLLIIAAEVCGTRLMEFSVITLNGVSRFGRAAQLVILASALRTTAAVIFYLLAGQSLAAWAWFNLASALAGAAIGLLFFLPRVRWRLKLALYPRRLKDAVLTAASELAFYAQAELDKVLVLSLAGDRAAGIYAIVLRLIDLTAIPVRSFNQMLVQRLMRGGTQGFALRRQALMEGGIAAISTLGMLGFVILLAPNPGLLGQNIERAAPLLLPMLLIPALRNLTEYHGELLYAREMVVDRLLLLCGLTALKLGLMAVLLQAYNAVSAGIAVWALPLTGVFAAVYAASAAVTYARLRGQTP